jgi:hypothetical protein
LESKIYLGRAEHVQDKSWTPKYHLAISRNIKEIKMLTKIRIQGFKSIVDQASVGCVLRTLGQVSIGTVRGTHPTLAELKPFTGEGKGGNQ